MKTLETTAAAAWRTERDLISVLHPSAWYHRLPMWKRAVLHGLKTLARRHPGAALQAAGATVAYAGREVIHDTEDFARDKAAAMGEALPDLVTHDEDKNHGAGACHAVLDDLSDEERKAFVESLSPEDRRALLELARET